MTSEGRYQRARRGR